MKKSTMPSIAALLGVLAVAGYQNRDKIGEFLRQQGGQGATGGDGSAAGGLLGGLGGGLDGLVKSATGLAASAGVSPSVIDGITDVVDRFRGAGLEKAADSWVSTGSNEPLTPDQTETALGTDLIGMLVEQTGLSREDILKRLADVLPQAVDAMTPEGKLPAA